MPSCTHCGAQVQSSDRFCGNCGRTPGAPPAPPFTAPSSTSPFAVAEGAPTLPYLLSPTRVLVMTVLTYGLYLFYWFYLTWRQYRDHTGHPVFPVWHALTLLAPVYGLFRVHAHIRTYRELMVGANVPCALSAGWSVVLVIVYSVLSWASFQVSGGFGSLMAGEEVAREAARTRALLEAVGIVVVAGLLLSAQGNLNRYWASLGGRQLASARIGVGEVVFVIIGILSWADTLGAWLSPAYRQL